MTKLEELKKAMDAANAAYAAADDSDTVIGVWAAARVAAGRRR